MYATIAEVKAESLCSSYSDPVITNLITIAQQYIEVKTDNFFEARSLTLKLDGSGIETLNLLFPVISVSAIKENDIDIATLSDVIVYNRHLSMQGFKEDLYIPKLVWNNDDGIFTRGTQNWKITGKFGWTEYLSSNVEGQTPPLIKYATIYVIKKMLLKIGDPLYEALFLGNSIDPQGSYKTQSTALILNQQLTGDRLLDELLLPYCRPAMVLGG